MKFTLEIELGAVHMKTPHDIAIVLGNLVIRLSNLELFLPDEEPIKDWDWNTVGTWKVTE